MATNAPDAPMPVFIAYAREDEKFLDELHAHLAPLRREGLIDVWYDRRIEPGQDWEQEIDEQISICPLILMLISADFINSEYCYGRELKRAMERHEKGEARVIPIIVRPCDWKHSPFAKLNALPLDGKPVSTWRPRDSAWTNVAVGIRTAVQSLLERKSTESGREALPPIDLETIVFSAAMEVVAASNYRAWSFSPDDLLQITRQQGISDLETRETLRSLSQSGLLRYGTGPIIIRYPGREVGLRLTVPDYAERTRRIQQAICRLHPVSADKVAEDTSLPIGIVAHAFEFFENENRLRRTLQRNHAPTMDPLPDFCPRPVGLQPKDHEVLRHLVRRVAEHPEAFLSKLLFWPGGDNQHGYQSVATREAPVPEGEKAMLTLRQDITGPLVRQGFLMSLGNDEFAMTPRLFQAYGFEMPDSTSSASQ